MSFVRPFLAIFSPYLNWGSDGHFEVLNRSYLWLVEKLWRKMQIFQFLFFLRFCTKRDICIFFVFYIFVFFVITFVPIRIQTSSAPQNDHWNLSFVKDKRVVGQTWPDMVQKWLFISCYFLGARRTCTVPQTAIEAITFDPIKYVMFSWGFVIPAVQNNSLNDST